MVQMRMAWHPSQHSLQLCRTCAEHWRVARSAFGEGNGDLSTTDLLCSIQHLLHRVAVAGADVEYRHSGVIEKSQRPNVRIGDIEYVDIVSQARAVWRWIVRSEDLDRIDFSRCDLQQTRNEMGFRIVPLTHAVCRPTSIEVARSSDSPAIRPRIPTENALEHKLAFTVGSNRIFRMIFWNRHGPRISVDGCSGGKDELSHSGATQFFEKPDPGCNVRVEEQTRLGH